MKADQYAKAGIHFSWRIEQPATESPIAHLHVLDPATERYQDAEVFMGAVKASMASSVEVDKGNI